MAISSWTSYVSLHWLEALQVKKVLVLAAALGAVSSFAQMNDNAVTPYQAAVRLGLTIPVNSDLGGGVFLSAGFDYTLDRSLLPNGQTYFSFDYIGKNTSGNRNNMYNFILAQRFGLGENSGLNNGSMRTYAFAGIGAAVLDFGGNAATVLSGKVGLGAEFSPNIFGEVSLNLTTRGKGAAAQGNFVGFYVGYRF